MLNVLSERQRVWQCSKWQLFGQRDMKGRSKKPTQDKRTANQTGIARGNSVTLHRNARAYAQKLPTHTSQARLEILTQLSAVSA